MKIIDNFNLAFSFNKGKRDILYETAEEVIENWKLEPEMFSALMKMKLSSGLIGFVKCLTDGCEEDGYNFISIYQKELENGDFRVVHNDVRVYNDYLIIFCSTSDFRSKMVSIDKGLTNGLLKFSDF